MIIKECAQLFTGLKKNGHSLQRPCVATEREHGHRWVPLLSMGDSPVPALCVFPRRTGGSTIRQSHKRQNGVSRGHVDDSLEHC